MARAKLAGGDGLGGGGDDWVAVAIAVGDALHRHDVVVGAIGHDSGVADKGKGHVRAGDGLGPHDLGNEHSPVAVTLPAKQGSEGGPSAGRCARCRRTRPAADLAPCRSGRPPY